MSDRLKGFVCNWFVFGMHWFALVRVLVRAAGIFVAEQSNRKIVICVPSVGRLHTNSLSKQIHQRDGDANEHDKDTQP